MVDKKSDKKSNKGALDSKSNAASKVAEKKHIDKKKSHFLKDLSGSLETTFNSYFKTLSNSPKLLLIDTFCLFLVLLGVIQFVFVLLVGNFPFNAFLSGFISAVGQFVLTVSLRLQWVEVNRKEFGTISGARAVGDYIFSSLILHFVAYHFIN